MKKMQNLKIAVGADHGGFVLKEQLKEFLKDRDITVFDCGTDSTDAVDYPKFALAVARKVAAGEADFGIMVDGAGIGSAMTANKVLGIRAALCYDVSTAKNAREHNDARVLTLGAGLIGTGLAQQIVETFITSECTADRHLRRVQMITDIEQQPDIEFSAPQSAPPVPVVETGISESDLVRITDEVEKLLAKAGITLLPTGVPQPLEADYIRGKQMVQQPDTVRKFLDFGVERVGYHNGTGCENVPEDIARCIDHTVLKPDATDADIKKLCGEAREFHFATVCISPSYVKLAAKELDESDVKVCTVVGFPSGAHSPEIKAMETRQAIRDGAKEIDMVINIGALKSGKDDLVYRDIRAVCEACEDGSATSKVIIEAALLTDDEKVRACELAQKARANFVKTSTGFGPGGATAEDVALMNRVVGKAGLGVKAAGGIRSYDDARKMVEAGATRIGASASIGIVKGAQEVTITN